jgi:hypothetical protein
MYLLWSWQVCSSQQLTDTTGRLVYMMTLKIRSYFYLSNGSQASIIMSPDPQYLLERSIKLITVHFHHPVKFIIIDLFCILINCMVSRGVVGGPHATSLHDSKMMVKVHSEIFHTHWLFPHFDVLQHEFKMV